ncbi:MAG TPA: nucleoside triphosphate pyrophosphohydrolase [Alphaproteobacteria bacterium]|jgi:MazG family protein|nr:nucleoside triphosphate pyrophosphohydrolase [Alphaproteobacteria bacterium]
MSGRQDISALLAIMARLRAPDGCPWDREQDFGSIAPYTIEEAYEVADAIARQDMDGLKDELGDLLFQTVYHTQLAAEIGAFTFAEVVDAICSKMIRRHPHVFGDAQIADAAAQTLAWEEYKAQERAARPGGDTRKGLLDGVPLNLPALTRAHKLQGRASKAGFDWRQTAPVIGKLREEIGELEAEIAAGASEEKLQAELGDILFSAVNLARHLRLDPEAALRGANRKFEQRFAYIEQRLAKTGKKPADCTLAELDALWEEAKQQEAAAKPAI